MQRLVLGIILSLLTGCTSIGAVVGTTEDAVDEALDINHRALCDKHWPLRAYHERYGARWAELVAFCEWDAGAPPGPAQ